MMILPTINPLSISHNHNHNQFITINPLSISPVMEIVPNKALFLSLS